jgi:hypothetical protein
MSLPVRIKNAKLANYAASGVCNTVSSVFRCRVWTPIGVGVTIITPAKSRL